MKKLFLSIASIVIASVMCIGLAACGNNRLNTKSINGEEITGDQWVAALDTLLDDKANFTVEYYYEQTTDYTHKTMVHTTEWSAKSMEIATLTKNGALESSIGSEEISISGDTIAAEQVVGKAKTKEIEVYSAIISRKIYNYEKGKDGKWNREEAKTSVIYDEFGFAIAAIKDKFSSFVYSTEHKGYIDKNYEDGDTQLMVFKFNGGKLAAIYAYAEVVDLTDIEQEYELIINKTEAHLTIEYKANEIVLPVVG